MVLPPHPPTPGSPFSCPTPTPPLLAFSYTNTDSWLMSFNYLPLPSHYDNAPKWQGCGGQPLLEKSQSKLISGPEWEWDAFIRNREEPPHPGNSRKLQGMGVGTWFPLQRMDSQQRHRLLL